MPNSGPLFDGRAAAAAVAYTSEAEQAIADEGVSRIRTHLGGVLQHPTGAYESAIHTERQVADLVITDMPIVYGPWLEGVGSRNETTRFKGYHTFRLISQQLDDESVVLATRVLPPYLGAMNE